ncbi:acyl-CoA dehydratase activase [Candidatus Latescibacterota bacterium]
MTVDGSGTVLGIDLGSRNVKLCLMDGGRVRSSRVIETVAFYRDFGRQDGRGFSVDVSSLGFDGAGRMVSTGYGRMSAALAGAASISELTAHSIGARFQTGLDTFTLLDMGGQDYKIVRIAGGRMIDMATNDKCAASTGRYIENMSRVLGLTVEEIGRYVEEPATLSSTCAIFGESELIGLMVKGIPVPRLAAGVNRSVVERVLPLLERMGEETIVMSGGVALNGAVVENVARLTGRTVRVVDDPLLNGAIGCCVGAAG